jgi:hypothetical protein
LQPARFVIVGNLNVLAQPPLGHCLVAPIIERLQQRFGIALVIRCVVASFFFVRDPLVDLLERDEVF